MNSNKKMVDEVTNRIATGEVQPWKAETLLMKEYGILPPEHYRLAVLQEQGAFVYSGMGGEIIPALYRAAKVNPRPCNVSCTENLYVEIKGDDVIFGVELPNLEIGVASSREGPICPTAREVLKFIGINNSKEFAAAAAAITLAGEFNFTLLHIRGEMYASK